MTVVPQITCEHHHHDDPRVTWIDSLDPRDVKDAGDPCFGSRAGEMNPAAYEPEQRIACGHPRCDDCMVVFSDTFEIGDASVRVDAWISVGRYPGVAAMESLVERAWCREYGSEYGSKYGYKFDEE